MQTKLSPVDKSKNDLLGVSSWTEPMSNLDETKEEEICSNEMINICNFRSRLSKTLPQILADQNALGYFIQYMDSKDCIALIKFWLEVECLCRASTDQMIENKSQINLNETLFCKGQSENITNGCMSDNTEKFNYDKPKSKSISDEDFSNIDKQVSNTRQDAIRIYKKYIASNALGPNRIPSELKSEIGNDFVCQSIESMLKILSAVQQIVYRVLEEE